MVSDQEIVKLLQTDMAFRYTDLASVMVMLYDFTLVFERERSLIWGSGPWTFVKASYLLVRYSPFLESVILLYHHFTPSLSREVCSSTYKANGWLCFIGMAVAEAVQSLRTWAVWKRDQKVGWILATTFVLVTGSSGVLLAKLLSTLTFAPISVGPTAYKSCILTGGKPTFLVVIWALLMGMEFINLIFIVVHSIYYHRANRSQLTRAVYHSGILYYLYMFGISTINLIILLKVSSDAVLILTMMIRVLHSILTCRMILQIREHLGNCQPGDVYSSHSCTITE